MTTKDLHVGQTVYIYYCGYDPHLLQLAQHPGLPRQGRCPDPLKAGDAEVHARIAAVPGVDRQGLLRWIVHPAGAVTG